MSIAPSFYWHDYETFGIDPRRDWPSQFAGVRTNMDLEIIGEPLMIYCKPASDCLPHPEACLLTGISPLRALEEGLAEKDFIARIHEQMSQPQTCSVGYNSIRFDDEVTRNALYRNFYDPYQREYQNSNSRWDIIDLVRMAHALRPEGIEWPKNEDGQTSFRLELLSKANGIGHEAAHDALSDVYATIGMAKLIKQKQPKLFEYYFALRQKHKAFDLLHRAYQEPVLHVSSKYPVSQYNLAVVMSVCPDPKNNNGVVVCDLSGDLEQLLDLDADTLNKHLFTKAKDLPEGVVRPPVKTVHANKSPALAPMNTLRVEDKERLQLDENRIQANSIWLKKYSTSLQQKIKEMLTAQSFEQSQEPELMLYGGGFFGSRDKNLMQKFLKMGASALKEAQQNLNADDKRIPEMLFRYRARNFLSSLNEDEQERWGAFCREKLSGHHETSSISLSEFENKLADLKMAYQDGSEKKPGNENQARSVEIVSDLERYASQLAAQCGL